MFKKNCSTNFNFKEEILKAYGCPCELFCCPYSKIDVGVQQISSYKNWSLSDQDPKLIIQDPANNFGSDRIHNTAASGSPDDEDPG